MPTILNNVTAMMASRQIGTTQMGLKQAIERLTTGKRINRASDDAAGLQKGTIADATARTARETVKLKQQDYFAAQASDAYLEEAANQALRLAELEGGGNGSSSEATTVKGLITAAATAGGSSSIATTSASAALADIATARGTLAATMATALSNSNIKGIESENNFAIAENIMGADIGAEMVNLTKYQILMQAGISALGNANQSSQLVLGLLR